MMNMEMIQKEREANIKKMWDELLDVQMELIDDKKVCETNRVDFSFAPCYFELENIATDGCRIIRSYFSCDNLETLKNCLHWVLKNTDFSHVTAYVENKSYVTFYSMWDLKRTFDNYYCKQKGRCEYGKGNIIQRKAY